jgi:hypothetical protein
MRSWNHHLLKAVRLSGGPWEKEGFSNFAMGALGNPSQPLTARQQSTLSLVNHSGYHDYISLTFRSDIEGKTVLIQAT